jgi:hypothetical protein
LRRVEKEDRIAINLEEIVLKLDASAKYNPCPACKHDTEQLSKFISKKAESIRTGGMLASEDVKPLKEVDYVGVVEDMAIWVSKAIRPFTRLKKVPEIYKKVLLEDTEGNKRSLECLIEAKKLLDKLDSADNQLKLVSEILDSFIRALNFKLSIDEYSFYIFDKVIRFGYRTHLLSATGKIIVWVKELINPSRYA